MPARRTGHWRSRRRPQSTLSSAPSQSRNSTSNPTPTSSFPTPLRIRFRLPTSPLTRFRQCSPTTTPVGPAELSPWDSHEIALIRAGYQPAYDPPKATPAPGATTATGSRKQKTVRFKMAEPRARAARQKGQMNFGPESTSPGLMSD